MSGRDPIQALMKKAGVKAQDGELTRHPAKAALAAEKFHIAAERLEAGDIIAAGVAASQAQALLEVLHALLLQDRHEVLRDPKCGGKRQAEELWQSLLNPSEGVAKRLATHYRESRLNYIATTPPYVAPPPQPKPKVERDGTRYITVFEANAPEAAEQYGLPTHLEFKHGVSRTRGYMLSVHDAVGRKLRREWPGDWSVNVIWRNLPGAGEWAPRYTGLEFSKNSYDGERHEQFRVGYRIVSTTHNDGQEAIDKRDAVKKR